MPESYLKQRSELPEKERLDEGAVRYLNTNRLPEFLKLLGLELQPGGKAPESAGVPRLFILDEEKPNEPRTLTEAGAEVGSTRFWELARMGKLFGYPAGEKEPVQVQLKDEKPGRLYLSEPLSPDGKKLASRNYKYEGKKPTLLDPPREVARPGFLARLLHGINSNWYKLEHDAYAKYRADAEAVRAENLARQEAYRAEAEKAEKEMDKLCRSVSEGLEKAFAANRTKDAFDIEKETKRVALEAQAKASQQESRESAAADAEAATKRVEDGVENMMSIYAPKPKALPRITTEMKNGKVERKGAYSEESLRTLTPVELPKDLKIGDKAVDDRMFANLALHAQQDKDICREWFKESFKTADDPMGDFKKEGLTEQDLDDLAIITGSGMFVGDVVKAVPRVDFDQHFEKRVQPARQAAAKAIEAYQAGNKEPMAKIIAVAARNLVLGSKADLSVGEAALADTKLTNELLDLLDEDEGLWEAAEKNGLTEKEVEYCRGLDCLRELEDASLKADAKLMKAAAEKKELEAPEKAQCLHDIFKYRTAQAFIRDELKVENSKNLMTVNKKLETRYLATLNKQPLPEGTKPLKYETYERLLMFNSAKLKRLPSTPGKLLESKELAEEAKLEGKAPEPDFLDGLTDMTVKSLKLDTKDTAYLAEKIGRGHGLKEEGLLAHESKLIADRDRAEAKKAIEEKKEREAAEELDTAVIYDGPGM